VRAAAEAAAASAGGYVNRVRVDPSRLTQSVLNRAAEDSTTHPYRAIVEAQLREFDLLTSIEIDLYKKFEDATAVAAAAASAKAASAAAAPAGLTSTLAPAPSFPPDRLSSFLELKTVGKHRWDKTKKSDVWVQTFLGGVPRTIVGFKDVYRELTPKELKLQRKAERKAAHEAGVAYAYDEQTKLKASKRANQKADHLAAKIESEPVAINDVQEQETRFLIDPNSKEQLMRRFYNVLRFLAQHVQEGRVYKLEHRKRSSGNSNGGFVHPDRQAGLGDDGEGGETAASSASGPGVHAQNWGIFLEEVEGGVTSQPVVAEGMLSRVDAWAEQVKLQQEEAARLEAEAAAAGMGEKEHKKQSKQKKSSSSSSSSSKKKKNNKDGTDSAKKQSKKKKRKSPSGDGERSEEEGADEKKKKKSKKKKSSKKKEGDKDDDRKKSKKAKKSEDDVPAPTTAASDSDSDSD
jgi:hypothetical protein